jgi:hypothetical protein
MQHRFASIVNYLLAMLIAAGLGLAPADPAFAQAKVVGNGTPGSCTRAALAAALDGGGYLTFNCGGVATIAIDATLSVTAAETTIDGGGSITLAGQGVRIFLHESYQVQSRLTLRNLTLTGGRAIGAGTAANGAAVWSDDRSASQRLPPILTLEGVTVRDNDTTTTSIPSGRAAYDFGGAIYARAAKVIVRNSSFIDNDANAGGGGALHMLQSSLEISDSSFSNNTAIGAQPQDSQGGAIYVDGLGGASGVLSILRSRFENNRANNQGGAIYVNMYENSTLTEIWESSFISNRVVGGVVGHGGAVAGGGTGSGANGNPRINISRSLFVDNSVRRTPGASGNPNEDGSGGALSFPQRARISISNSTFFGNRAFGAGFNANGGALYVVNHAEPFEINNSTFAGNRAGWVGGAISNSKVSGAAGGRVRNTIFRNNTADNGPNNWQIQQHCSSELAHDNTSLQYPPRLTGGNFFNDVTCFEGKSAPDQVGDAVFRDAAPLALADNGGATQTMAVTAGSPARDGGSNCLARDQRGIARPQGAGCDIGAYEDVTILAVDMPLIAAGSGDRTVALIGSGFSAGSVVQIDGADAPTVFVSQALLRFEIAAGALATPGNRTITVSGPGSALSATTIRVAPLQRVQLPLLGR